MSIERGPSDVKRLLKSNIKAWLDVNIVVDDRLKTIVMGLSSSAHISPNYIGLYRTFCGLGELRFKPNSGSISSSLLDKTLIHVNSARIWPTDNSKYRT